MAGVSLSLALAFLASREHMYGGETYDLIKHFPYELPVSFSSAILYIKKKTIMMYLGKIRQ